jgi:SAM-dependent methyltransferase
MIDRSYTTDDHEFRTRDAYAAGKYDITLRWLESRRLAGRQLLNVGCGGGLFNELAAHYGYAVEACEPDLDAALIARRSAPKRVSVQQCDLFGLQLETPVHVAVLHDVLEHIEDDALAMRRLYDLVNPNGVIVISVPALPSLYGKHDERLGHHRRYVKGTLRAVVEPYFEIDRLRYYGMTFIPLTFWISRVRRSSYPTTTASTGVVGRIFGALCRAEAAVPTPIGTSLICLASRRPTPLVAEPAA